MNKLLDLMVDLETMGHKSNSVICSIGAVEFDIATGETGRTFYERVSIESCLQKGLRVDGSTIEWWLTKSEAARSEISKGGLELHGVLCRFWAFLDNAKDLRLWGNSVRFDMGILQDAYNACSIAIPWETRKELDVRTLVFLNPDVKANCDKAGIAHNALDDCYYQIRYCHEILKSISVCTK